MSNLSSHDPERRAEELVQRMLEQGLSDADHAELMQCLQHDVLARERFFEQAYLHSLLREQSGLAHPKSLTGQLFGVRPEELTELGARLSDARSGSRSLAPIEPVSMVLAGAPNSGWNGFFGKTGLAVAAFCTVVAIVTATAFVAVSQRSSTVDLKTASVKEQTTPAVSPEMLEVRSVHLDFGTTRLSLPKVGYIVIEGPAEIDLLGPMRARLRSGRIKMRVTEATGRGFIVETPYGEITDLGTEFGIDLTEKGQAGLVVFEGAVDLRVGEASALAGSRVERFVGGEGVVFNKVGELNRLSTIITGTAATFLRQNEMLTDQLATNVAERQSPLIVAVDDNLRSTETKKFYAIVPGGLQEDARAYADAIHEWNGVTSDGIPPYLIGADYVRMFNLHSIQKKFGICVKLARPAKLYVFLDARSTPPDWLIEKFRYTGDRIGLDAGRSRRYRSRTVCKGPAEGIDEQFTIWECEVSEPGVVRLGTNLGKTSLDPGPATYGNAAVLLDTKELSKIPESTISLPQQ